MAYLILQHLAVLPFNGHGELGNDTFPIFPGIGGIGIGNRLAKRSGRQFGFYVEVALAFHFHLNNACRDHGMRCIEQTMGLGGFFVGYIADGVSLAVGTNGVGIVYVFGFGHEYHFGTFSVQLGKAFDCFHCHFVAIRVCLVVLGEHGKYKSPDG